MIDAEIEKELEHQFKSFEDDLEREMDRLHEGLKR